MKNFLALLLIVTGTLGLAQDKTNNIKGKVTYLDTPLVNAEVRVSTTGESVKTDTEGIYAIQAAPGQILTYSYPSMRTMEIVVEDVTSILNIELTPEVNQLDEVVVSKTVLKSQKQLQGEYATNKNLINTAFGILDKDVTSFAVRIMEGKDLGLININLASAIQFRFPGVRVDQNGPTIYLRGGGMGFFPAIYDVDGLILRDFPQFIQIENVERIAIIPGLGAVTKYGGAANGGVIVINTKGANYFPEPGTEKPYDQAKLRDNIFSGDALSSEDLKKDKPSYYNLIMKSSTEGEAQEIYKNQIASYGNSYHYVLDAYDYFSNRWKNVEFAEQIISNNKQLFDENPLALKALAYFYQAEGKLDKANEIYKQIFTLRPNYAQSYMDMANSYRELGEYQKAAAIYARYGYLLDEGFLRAEGDLGVIMDRELNNLIVVEGNELLSKRELKKLILDDEFDGTRLVFEWNDSEAEFELQFVNPEGNYYTSEHSLYADADRIKDEKISGFSSEEYLIDDSLRGIWRVNAKYLGNKSLTPTYLKATIYHNYGSASQRKETKVFKFSLKNVNQQLFTVSNMATVVSN